MYISSSDAGMKLRTSEPMIILFTYCSRQVNSREEAWARNNILI